MVKEVATPPLLFTKIISHRLKLEAYKKPVKQMTIVFACILEAEQKASIKLSIHCYMIGMMISALGANLTCKRIVLEIYDINRWSTMNLSNSMRAHTQKSSARSV